MTKEQSARELANKHYLVEAGLTKVFRLTGSAEAEVDPNEPIKLLEVNEDTIASGIMPVRFGPVPSLGIPFSSIILEVTPDEFEQIETNELTLPNGWTISESIPRPEGSELE